MDATKPHAAAAPTHHRQPRGRLALHPPRDMGGHRGTQGHSHLSALRPRRRCRDRIRHMERGRPRPDPPSLLRDRRPPARTGLRARLYFGHFSFGIAEVIHEPLDRRIALRHHLLPNLHPQRRRSGRQPLDWSRYMGDRQFGWSGLRPVCDILSMFPELNDVYLVEGPAICRHGRHSREPRTNGGPLPNRRWPGRNLRSRSQQLRTGFEPSLLRRHRGSRRTARNIRDLAAWRGESRTRPPGCSACRPAVRSSVANW